jgi:hypothetical protein
MTKPNLENYPNIRNDFLSTILDIPRIVPDDWDTWWDYWNKESKRLSKVYASQNGEPGLNHWHGVQIYGDDTVFDPWDIKTVDCQHLFPKMFETIFSLPINIQRIRAVKSLGMFTPHKDHPFPLLSCRVMFHDTNPTPTFFYLANNKVSFQHVPKLEEENNSNTWIYPDQSCDHGTFHSTDYEKILFMILGEWDTEKLNELIDRSLEKYKDFVIK